MMTILAYDGSFEGFLTCVFCSYEFKLNQVKIQKQDQATPNLYDHFEIIVTDLEKADRVWSKLTKTTTSKSLRLIYKAFLSELSESEDLMLSFIKKILHQKKIENDFSDRVVLRLAQISKMVDREKHRMDAFVRFRLTKDNIYFATISPDFNVLPLNAKHFKNRYADQRWIIYDLKRNYGLFYDLKSVSAIDLKIDNHNYTNFNKTKYYTEEELQFEQLWKNYFRSTNIESRKNTKLHTQHIPKRYWKFLTEKSS